MDSIYPLDPELYCHMSDADATSDLPTWDQCLNGNDDNSEQTSFTTEYDNVWASSFNDLQLLPFQTITIPSSDSYSTSSYISDPELSIDLLNPLINSLGYIPRQSNLGHSAYGIAPPISELYQDTQTPLNYAHTPSQLTTLDTMSKGKERELLGSSLTNAKGSIRKLRTASRKSKNSGEKKRSSTLKTDDHKNMLAQKGARECHNMAEKQYRNKLNSKYTMLLDMIPVASEIDSDESSSAHPDESVDLAKNERRGSQGVSRSEILDSARYYIKRLEGEERVLKKERERLLRSLEEYVLVPNT